MKLTAIEATRFGGLEGACLTGLGDGLTVVLGPNESGKSTLTALTRYVLYGFPDGRSKEHGYVPSSGPRAARLVFDDPAGEWSIGRVDGKNRGPVTVAASRGAERPDLLGELVGGVSEQTYKVVFGFGLDELKQIESGDSTDVVKRLYAAGTGLAVNPMDARKQLDDEAKALYSKGASKPVVNALAGRIREVKGRIATLEAEASEYASDQVRLAELAATIEPLCEQRDALDARLQPLEQDAARFADASSGIEGLALEIAAAQRARTDAERALELLDVDEAVLAAAPELTAVLDEASGFRTRVEAAGASAASAHEARRRAAAIAVPPLALDSAENRAAVDARRDRLTELRMRVQATEDAARQAEAQVQAARLVAEQAPPPVPPAPSRMLPIALAGALILAGVTFAALGFVQQQFVVAGLGAVVAVLGIVAVAIAVLRAAVAAPPESGLSADVAELAIAATAARALADADAADAQAAQAEWLAWLASRGLDAQGDDPIAVRSLLDDAAQRQRLLGEAEAYDAAARREQEAAEAWVVRLVTAVQRYDAGAGQIPPLSEAPTLAERARHDLRVAREAAAERERLSREGSAARVQLDRLAESDQALRVVVAAIVARHDLGSDAPQVELATLLERAREGRTAARDDFDARSREHSALGGKLDIEGRGDAMARARQELASLQAEAAEAADRYLVSALSVALLDRARERFERERQPEVVRTAGRVFKAMTGGRYTDVRVPLDNSGITVVTEHGGVRSTAELSRGTQEQLYLALRVGLIRSLGVTGSALPILMDDVVVNFDPERRAGAVTAVAELAAMRQVLFFTCHPETAQVLAESVPGARLVSLDRCELR
jgi:uncharacterized protein YhaN